MKTKNFMKTIAKTVLVLLCTCGMLLAPVKDVQAKGGIESLLDAAPLYPMQSQSQPTSEIVSSVLAQVTTDEMSTYQKVKACYDYLINNCSYGNQVVIMDESDSVFVSILDMEAFDILNDYVGVCDNYSAAFVALTRAIGVESYFVGGQVRLKSGGYTPHAWAVIVLDGKEYIFDPQIEDKVAAGGKIGYIRFGKTYDQLKGKYISDGYYQVTSIVPAANAMGGLEYSQEFIIVDANL